MNARQETGIHFVKNKMHAAFTLRDSAVKERRHLREMIERTSKKRG